MLCGEVHDDNAYAMGGVAGHAGLFASARDIDTLLCSPASRVHGPGRRVLPAEHRARVLDARPPYAGSTWALGWDTPSPGASQSGSLFSPDTVGHLGFTGTSIWIDLERDRHVILLTNRVHPSRDNAGDQGVPAADPRPRERGAGRVRGSDDGVDA